MDRVDVLRGRLGIKDFEVLYSVASEYAITPKLALHSIYEYAMRACCFGGAVAEAGTFRGGSLYIIASVFDGEIHSFDSFAGLPTPSDIHDAGQWSGRFSGKINDVKELVSFNDKVKFYKGFFIDTFPTVSDNACYSFVYIDVDLYESARQCLAFFYKRLVSGGVILVDDCYCDDTPGVRIALNEFISSKSVIAGRLVGHIMIEKR